MRSFLALGSLGLQQFSFILMADTGYPLESILITQFGNPATDEERTFNREFKKLRKDVECAIGRFKGRFRCLDKSGGFLQYDPEVCCKIITVCGVLHNFLVWFRMKLLVIQTFN